MKNLFLAFIFIFMAFQHHVIHAAGEWTYPVIITGPSIESGILPRVGMDGKGNALAVWTTDTNDAAWSSYLPAGSSTWTTPVKISNSENLVDSPNLAINHSGQTVAVWQLTDGTVRANTFSKGVWSTPRTISNDTDIEYGVQNCFVVPVRISIDDSGQAMAIWFRSDGVNQRIRGVPLKNFPGHWGTPFFVSSAGVHAVEPDVDMNNGFCLVSWSQIDTSTVCARRISFESYTPGPILNLLTIGGATTSSRVKVDRFGNGVVIWKNVNTQYIQAATISSDDVISAPTTLSNLGTVSLDPALGMDKHGNALAVWMEFENPNTTFCSKILPKGGSWLKPQTIFSTTNSITKLVLAENEVGNAALVWHDETENKIEGSTLTCGHSWTKPETLSFFADSPEICISPACIGSIVAVWSLHSIGDSRTSPSNGNRVQASEGRGFFPIIPIVTEPTPPSRLIGAVVKDKMLTQTDTIYRMNWLPSLDPTVQGYHVYRNGVLVATISSAGPFFYADHNRRPKVKDTYEVRAFNTAGESTPISITLG